MLSLSNFKKTNMKVKNMCKENLITEFLILIVYLKEGVI